MSGLMRANLYRLKKSRAFWAGLALLLCFCALERYGESVLGGGPGIAGRTWPQGSLFLIPVHLFLAGFCGLFAGTEYRDGTIRNKIALGSSRRTIYLAFFYINALAGALFFAAALGGSIFFGALFSMEMKWGGETVFLWAAGLTSCVAGAAVYTIPAMLFSRRAAGTAAALMLGALMLLAGFLLQERLPASAQTVESAGEESNLARAEISPEGRSLSWREGDAGEEDGQVRIGTSGEEDNSFTQEDTEYLAGDARAVGEMVCDILPGGQAAQISSGTMFRSGWSPQVRLIMVLACSVIVICVCNSIGIFFFWRKDIFQ